MPAARTPQRGANQPSPGRSPGVGRSERAGAGRKRTAFAPHRALEFRLFLEAIEAKIPPEFDVYLILDNYGIHETAEIRRGSHRSTRELENALRHYLAVCNENPKPFVWTNTADQILQSLTRFCKRISGTEH